MTNNSARRASIYLGIFMAIVLIAGAIIPLFTRNQTTTTESTSPTTAPIPTFPPPPSNLNAIVFDQVYLHPTGIFTIGKPDGWQVSTPNKGPKIAQINLVNNTTLSVVDSYVEDAGSITADQLSDRFTRDVINASWSQFRTWNETARTFDPATGKLQIDFNVSTANQQQYVARQQVWTDGRWIFVVRVLTPENATEMLRYLLDGFVSSFQPNTFFEGTPLDWTVYYDSDLYHLIRYPSDWTLTDSAPGRPTSISSSDGKTLRLSSAPSTVITDEAAARDFATSLRPDITITSVAPIQRIDSTGFAIAYTFTTVDGDPQSGLVDLLNGLDGTLHIADLRFPSANVDLNTVGAAAAPEATAEATPEVSAALDPYTELAQVMGTFILVSPIPLAPEGTPTPIPTIAPTATVLAEATAEMTAEATAEATVEAMPEATTEMMSEATPEATAES